VVDLISSDDNNNDSDLKSISTGQTTSTKAHNSNNKKRNKTRNGSGSGSGSASGAGNRKSRKREKRTEKKKENTVFEEKVLPLWNKSQRYKIGAGAAAEGCVRKILIPKHTHVVENAMDEDLESATQKHNWNLTVCFMAVKG